DQFRLQQRERTIQVFVRHIELLFAIRGDPQERDSFAVVRPVRGDVGVDTRTILHPGRNGGRAGRIRAHTAREQQRRKNHDGCTRALHFTSPAPDAGAMSSCWVVVSSVRVSVMTPFASAETGPANAPDSVYLPFGLPRTQSRVGLAPVCVRRK